MENYKREDLRPFILKANLTASNMKIFSKEELEEISSYLTSEIFFLKVVKICDKAIDQSEANSNISLLFFNKIRNVRGKSDHRKSIDKILETNNIKLF